MITKLENYTSYFNGNKIKWFIGDLNIWHAIKNGDAVQIKDLKKNTRNIIINNEGFIWEAWGSFNNHPYQLFAYCSRRKRKWWQFWLSKKERFYIKNPVYCKKEGDLHFDEKTRGLLMTNLKKSNKYRTIHNNIQI